MQLCHGSSNISRQCKSTVGLLDYVLGENFSHTIGAYQNKTEQYGLGIKKLCDNLWCYNRKPSHKIKIDGYGVLLLTSHELLSGVVHVHKSQQSQSVKNKKNALNIKKTTLDTQK